MQFNSLPLEIHLKIFSYLSVRQVLHIRRVCKQWKHLIHEEFKFERLHCSKRRYLSECDLNISSTWSLKRLSSEPMFRRLKQLNADLRSNYPKLRHSFVFLNSFESLEVLRLTCFAYRRSNRVPEKKQFVVRLHRLRRARIRLYLESKPNVLLDLPSLLCLELDSLQDLTIEHPQQLRTLVVNRLLPDAPDFPVRYSQFTGLTKFVTYARKVHSISARLIKQLPRLRELYLDDYRLFERRVFQDPPLPAASRQAAPKLFYFGFEVSLDQIRLEATQWPNDFQSYEATEETTGFIIQNRHRSVNDNSYIESVLYNPIASELSDSEMFGVMLLKFPKIGYLVVIGAVADEQRLLRFIDRFQIRHLALERASLSQRFFRRLAESCPSIRYLKIESEPTMNLLAGDFDFVFRCKNLKTIQFDDCPLSLNFVTELLSERRSVGYLRCRQRDHTQAYDLNLELRTIIRPRISLDVQESGSYANRQISPDDIRSLLKVLRWTLKTDGFVCPKEVLVLLRQLQFEKENALFWMRKFVYDQRHSICLPLGCLLNFGR